jgi:hypothetical protein
MKTILSAAVAILAAGGAATAQTVALDLRTRTIPALDGTLPAVYTNNSPIVVDLTGMSGFSTPDRNGIRDSAARFRKLCVTRYR